MVWRITCRRLFQGSETIYSGSALHRQKEVHQKLTNGEVGAATLEIAIVFPFFVMMLLAIAAVSWTWWVQSAATIASLEAVRASAYHQGESINPEMGAGSFYRAMTGISSSKSAQYIGLPDVHVNWATRTVSVSVDKGVDFSAGTLSAAYSFESGAFTRIQDFFGGPPGPDTWE